jgi:ribosomal protein S27E
MSNLDVSDECNAPVAPARTKKKVVGRKPHRRVLSPAGTYRCPKCDNEIIVFVRMSALPLCINHSASSGGAVSMEEVK